ncbi:MAG: hypothetical protein J5J06_15015 [Phycisphaerae bacterium]|nr:hypothetical protein [Phycisphaerae bacterium]
MVPTEKRVGLRSLGSAIIMTLLGLSSLSAGCDVGREFRAAALPQFSEGVTLAVNGLLDGIFAAIEVEPDSSGASG